MGTEIIRIPQYRIRGKKRYYNILVFPKHKYAWTYYEYWAPVKYCLDASIEYYEHVKHGLAATLIDPNLILYFPTSDPSKEVLLAHSYNYNLVIVRPQLQFKRSEWFDLKKKLDKNHRVEDFVLKYNEEALIEQADKLEEQRCIEYGHAMFGFKRCKRTEYYYKVAKRQNQAEQDVLLNDTVFFTLIRESCIDAIKYISIDQEDHNPDGAWPMGGLYCLGFVINNEILANMFPEDFEDDDNEDN